MWVHGSGHDADESLPYFYYGNTYAFLKGGVQLILSEAKRGGQCCCVPAAPQCFDQ